MLKNRSNKKTNVGNVIIIIGAILFAFAYPLAYFIGGMATDSGQLSAFWAGFFFIEAIPTLLILIGLIVFVINERKA